MDGGKGLDLEEIRHRYVAERGLGITSLEERTRMQGGTLDLTTQKGKATCLTIAIPVKLEIGGS